MRELMSKKYGNFYEEELDKWERLPATMLVLTSSYMGAWLQRRDERKGNRERIEELEKIKHEIGNEFVDLQDGSEEWRSYVNDAVLSCYEIVDKHISELKGENNEQKEK